MQFVFLCAALVVLFPFEMYIWGILFDALLTDTYLSKRIQLSVFFELPSWLLILIGICALCCILYALCALSKKSHKYDILLLCGLPLLVAVIFLNRKLPCAAAIGVPLSVFGLLTAWFTKPLKERQALFLSKDLYKTPAVQERIRALFLIFTIQCAGCLLFQYGFNYWFTFPARFILLLVLPFTGCLLKSTGKIRKYVSECTAALFLCGFLYIAMFAVAAYSIVTDISIVFAYLFFEIEIMVLLRRLFPEVCEQKNYIRRRLLYYFFRNISIFIFACFVWITPLIMPPLCLPLIVPLTAYILFILIENLEPITRKLFCWSRNTEYMLHQFFQPGIFALGWGMGMMLAIWLAGENRIMYIIVSSFAVFAGSLIRLKYQNDQKNDHIILQNFPYLFEVISLLAAILLLSGGSKEQTVVLICIWACVSTLMQTVWKILPVCSDDTCFSSRIFQTVSFAGTCFLLWTLFFFRAQASLLFGIYLILLGFIRIGEASYLGVQGRKCMTSAWVLVITGQIITVIPSEIRLPVPQWNRSALVCGVVVFAVFYLSYHIFTHFKTGKTNHEKEN